MDSPRRHVTSVQPVFFRKARLEDSACSRVALRMEEPLMSTAARNRPFASGDVIRVHTEVPPSPVKKGHLKKKNILETFKKFGFAYVSLVLASLTLAPVEVKTPRWWFCGHLPAHFSMTEQESGRQETESVLMLGLWYFCT